MSNRDKITGIDRQKLIIQTLKQQNGPVTGNELANMANVSRQVIVQDISLLKAKNEPIIATSQGYIYMKPEENKMESMVIACKHRPEQAEEELYILVDHGVFVKDVIVEHPVYGHITASLHIESRKEVDQFIEKTLQTNASFLSQLTDGIHLHTIEANTIEKLEEACTALKEAGILISSDG